MFFWKIRDGGEARQIWDVDVKGRDVYVWVKEQTSLVSRETVLSPCLDFWYPQLKQSKHTTRCLDPSRSRSGLDLIYACYIEECKIFETLCMLCYEKRLEVFRMITIKLVLQYMGCHHSIVKFNEGFEYWRVWVFCCNCAVLFGCRKQVASLFLLNWSGFPPLFNNLPFSFSSNIILLVGIWILNC